MDSRHLAKELFHLAVERVKPDRLMHEKVKRDKDRILIDDQLFDLSDIDHIFVVGAGKATALMAKALEEILGDRITSGYVITKYGHAVQLEKIILVEAAHPVPDQNGIEATKNILKLVSGASERDLVICLISGGGSALMTDLPENCTMEEIAAMNNLLLRCGANISEINCIRKHLSNIKGGHLAKKAWPARVLSLILSDVIGDPLDVIASGPTSPDPSTFKDALQVLNRYHIDSLVAPSILKHLRDGELGFRSETMKNADLAMGKTTNLIIGNNKLALTTACEAAIEMGYAPQIINDHFSGDVYDLAKIIVEIVEKSEGESKDDTRLALFIGGEATVRITGTGLGGRNQHLALILTDLLKYKDHVTVLCGGTDGTDGPTDAAGAVMNGSTYRRAIDQKLNVTDHLVRCDSYHFFEKEGGLIKTGPTRTNVMDLVIILIN